MSSKQRGPRRAPSAEPYETTHSSERLAVKAKMHGVGRKTLTEDRSPEDSGVKHNRSNAKLILTVGENIRALRVKLALTQTELAKEANISATHLGKIERGSTGPSLTTLASLAKALGVPLGPIFHSSLAVADMLGYEEDVTAPAEGPLRDPHTLLEYIDLAAGDTPRDRVSGYGETVNLPDGWIIAPDGNAYKVDGKGVDSKVELLLSASRVAELLHFSDRTLQKWIEQKLLTPSFYVAQGRIGSSDNSLVWTPHMIAGFRLSNLLDALQARSKGKVSKRRKRPVKTYQTDDGS